MRELEHHDVHKVTGGVATGWVPANWQLHASLREFAVVGGPGSIRIPGLIPGPILRPGDVLSSAPLLIPADFPGGTGPSQWEC